MAQLPAELIPEIRNMTGMALPDNLSSVYLKDRLSEYINDLIVNDFQKLVFLLYRIDVSEARLKHLLKENAGSDAAPLIADLIIERQVQKIESRKHNRRDSAVSDEESW
jgi:hypothetical protein